MSVFIIKCVGPKKSRTEWTNLDLKVEGKEAGLCAAAPGNIRSVFLDNGYLDPIRFIFTSDSDLTISKFLLVLSMPQTSARGHLNRVVYIQPKGVSGV